MASMHLGVIYQEDEGKEWKLFFFFPLPKLFPLLCHPKPGIVYILLTKTMTYAPPSSQGNEEIVLFLLGCVVGEIEEGLWLVIFTVFAGSALMENEAVVFTVCL